MDRQILAHIARTFNQEGIGWCVGGSLMLQCAGIEVQPKDIDLFVLPKDFGAALSLLNQEGDLVEFGPSSIFGSDRFARGRYFGEDVDLIAGMKIMTEDHWVEYEMDPSTVSKCLIEGEEVPYGNLSDWIVLYQAMDRIDKVRLIETYIQSKEESK